MTLNFFMSSITYLQYFIPIVIEANKREIKCIFYLRNIRKKYGDIFTEENNKILNKMISKYSITVGKIEEINPGPIIIVDGDIYGPYKCDSDSFLHKINRNNHTIYSLQENLNFLWTYDNFIDSIDYCIFPNKVYSEYYNKISPKNIFIGNTRYDLILKTHKIYKKYSLDIDFKYILFMYPKTKYINKYAIKSEEILKLYSYFHNCNYKIIVKTRPKDPIPIECYGDKLVSSDTYPNESLELMKISELCIFFSSTAIEECIISKIPFIDFCIDTELYKRYSFLYNNKICCQINDWRTNENINAIITKRLTKLKQKNSEVFDEIIDEFLFKGNISSKLIDFIIN